MHLDGTPRHKLFTRRMVVGSAATMAVARALAEECRIGPRGPNGYAALGLMKLAPA